MAACPATAGGTDVSKFDLRFLNHSQSEVQHIYHSSLPCSESKSEATQIFYSWTTWSDPEYRIALT
jgi:hypothetical protein